MFLRGTKNRLLHRFRWEKNYYTLFLIKQIYYNFLNCKTMEENIKCDVMSPTPLIYEFF